MEPPPHPGSPSQARHLGEQQLCAAAADETPQPHAERPPGGRSDGHRARVARTARASLSELHR
eukprot:12448964-Alexandrium_andersonii.AAC.1